MFGFTQREFTDHSLAEFLRKHGAIDNCRKAGTSNQWHDAKGALVVAVYSGEGGMTVTYWVREDVPKASVICIWEDLHAERSGYFRAFWCDSPTATIGSPVVGYASAGGSFRTIKAAAADAIQRHPGETVYRNGKPVS
jgi:hypothetical protein